MTTYIVQSKANKTESYYTDPDRVKTGNWNTAKRLSNCRFCNEPMLKGQWLVRTGVVYYEYTWVHLKCLAEIPEKGRATLFKQAYRDDAFIKIDWPLVAMMAKASGVARS